MMLEKLDIFVLVPVYIINYRKTDYELQTLNPFTRLSHLIINKMKLGNIVFYLYL